MQWNLNIQRAIASNTTGMIAYVGSRSVHNLMQTDDSSIVLPIAKTPEGYLWPCTRSAFDPQCTAGGQLQQPPGSPVVLALNPTLNPAFGRVPATFWNSDGIYHALELQVQKRLSHGLSGEVSYTWGRTIDTASGSTDGDQFRNGLSSQFFFDPRLRRGPSDFNQTHNVVVSYTWEIPSPKAFPSVLGWAASGWEFGGIFTASTGRALYRHDRSGSTWNEQHRCVQLSRHRARVQPGPWRPQLPELELLYTSAGHAGHCGTMSTFGFVSAALRRLQAIRAFPAPARTSWAMVDATALSARDSSTWTFPCSRTTM